MDAARTEVTIRWVGANRVERRYLVYAPPNLASSPAPAAFQLALKAPELVAAIAPVALLPFHPNGPWDRA